MSENGTCLCRSSCLRVCALVDVCSSEFVCVLACTLERDARDLSLPAYFGPFLFALALNSMELLLGEAEEEEEDFGFKISTGICVCVCVYIYMYC